MYGLIGELANLLVLTAWKSILSIYCNGIQYLNSNIFLYEKLFWNGWQIVTAFKLVKMCNQSKF